MSALLAFLNSLAAVGAAIGPVLQYGWRFLKNLFLPQAVLAARVLAAESQLAVCQKRLESQGVRRHRFSIKTAVDATALVQEQGEPPWVGPGAGGRDATEAGIEGEATDRVNGGLAEDDVWERGRGAAGMAKKPRSFWVPGAKPRQERPVVPRSSAPTGAFCSSRSRKTALALASA